jgi:hypothetical protein
VEKDLLPAASKENMEVISKGMPIQNKGNIGRVFLGVWEDDRTEPVRVHMGEHFRGGHISEHAQLRSTF